MIPFRLLGDSALGALRECTGTLLDDWRRDWFVSDAVLSEIGVYVPTSADLAATGALAWWCAKRKERECYVGLSSEGLPALAHRLMGTSAGEDASPLLAAVAKDALTDLADRLLRGEAPASPDLGLADAEIPAAMAQRGSGCVRLTVELDGLGMELWLDAAATAALAPRAAAPELSLVPLKSSLQGQRVTLSVELDLGTIPAQRLQALQPGDVVTTSASLHTDFAVLLPERGRIASGRLGRLGAHRAVVLDK